MTLLNNLDIGYTNVDDEGLLAITRSCTGLKTLNVHSCTSITDEGFASLSSLASLEELDVSGTSINDEGLRAIATSLTRLAKLDLHGCDSISVEEFTFLSSLPQQRRGQQVEKQA